MTVLIGVDLGQQRDPTAICVAEPEGRQSAGRTEHHFLVRHLQRLPLGTSYPEVARRLRDIVAGAQGRAGPGLTVCVDATGLGDPVVDLLRESSPGTRIVACYFNHGDRRTREGFQQVKIGKAYLVSLLQTLLQARRLHLPRTPEAEILAAELRDYEIRVDQDANDRYGAFKVGTHDDLVTALGLAVQSPPPVSLVWGRGQL